MADIKNHSTLTTSLVSYWDLEEASGTRYDLHGTNHLTDNNTVGYSASGKIGNSSDFIPANSESLSRSSISELNYKGTINCSISFWFKTDSVSILESPISHAQDISNANFEVYINSGSLNVSIGNQGAALTYGTSVSTGTWYHVVLTLSSSNTYELFINGSSVDTGSGATWGTFTPVFRIGGTYSTASRFFDGIVDEVGIWSKVLSSSEITDLYNSGNGLPYYDPTDVKNDSTLSTSLVSYWELEETSGTRVDSHGSNDLSDNNTVLYGTGILGNGADFERTNTEYLTITDAAQSGLDIVGDFTLSCWVKFESLPASGEAVYLMTKRGSTANLGGYSLRYSNESGTLYIWSEFQNTSSPFNSFKKGAFTASTGIWYHFATAVDVSAEDHRIIVNGVPLTSLTTVASGVTSPSNTDSRFTMGAYGDNSHPMDGLIDEAAIWSKQITYAEARALYGYGTPPEYEVGGAASGPANLKSYNTNLKANIKSINTNPIANVKSLNTNV